jgi:hypothetical protein
MLEGAKHTKNHVCKITYGLHVVNTYLHSWVTAAKKHIIVHGPLDDYFLVQHDTCLAEMEDYEV